MPLRQLILIFGGSLLFLSWNAGEAEIATGWTDPVGRIGAQDEAVYAASTLRMAEQGDWVTPYFMGRYALHKPPLLYWLSASSVRSLGRSNFALRLPSLLAGALTVTIAAAWVATSAASGPMAWASGWLTAILLCSSHLFFVLSRLAMTDVLLLAALSVALFSVHHDPALTRRSSLWIFGIACGAAIMTKAAAGLLPILIVVPGYLFGKERPTLRRLGQAMFIVLAVSAPWHLAQLTIHPNWFWTEYVLHEHFMKGLSDPAQSSSESHLMFYGRRLLLLDPFLLIGATAAGIALRRKIPREIAMWIGVALGVALFFRYRNASYLLPIYPALAILVGLAVPRRWVRAVLVVAVVVVLVKIWFPQQPWGLPFSPELANPSYAALNDYAAQKRNRELIILEPDDQFYAALLPLPHLRYGYVGAAPPPGDDPLDFRYMGVTVSLEQFQNLEQERPALLSHLREYDLDSQDPIATVILLGSRQDAEDLIASHPTTDFYLPRSWVGSPPVSHRLLDATDSRVFLLGR